MISSTGRSNTATAPIRVTARPSSPYTASSGFLRPLASPKLLDTSKGIGAPRRKIAAKKTLALTVGGRASIPTTASGSRSTSPWPQPPRRAG